MTANAMLNQRTMNAFLLVLKEIDQCEVFFGVRHDSVNPLNVAMWKSNPRPEWLVGKPKLQDLPRYARFGKATPHFRIPHPRATLPAMAERVIWVVENATGPWKVQYKMNTAMFFTDLRDAILYRLKWSD